ncbi:hypothetical protein GCM10008090_08520 [Arenicella chitinivorans]|uniref:PqqD family protein n=1 Tax=Arenicella chitinivorans TaxID=1329800 RepID=A0A918RKJ8_9GAMM|nr:PqqD family protein [Arenicella chitinivorans]GHA01655.1 hypothetical protein GCM10008090_08520 [Arenicella chitinivorans]
MHYRLGDNILLTELDDEAVLLDVSSGSYYGLNAVGARYLSLLNSGTSDADSVRQIADEYEQTLALVSTDLAELRTDLLANALIVERSKDDG